MEKPYEDAYSFARKMHNWEVALLIGKHPVSERPTVLKEHLLAVAEAPGRDVRGWSDSVWTEQDKLVLNLTAHFLRTVDDSHLHPSLFPEPLKYPKLQEVEAHAEIMKIHEMIALLGQLPRASTHPRELEQTDIMVFNTDIHVYEMTRGFLIALLADLWYKTKSEEDADLVFDALLKNMSGLYGKLALEAIEKVDSYAGRERIRRAIFRIHAFEEWHDGKPKDCFKSLAHTLLNKLSHQQIVVFTKLDEELGDALSPVAEELLLTSAKKIGRLEQAAKQLTDKIRHSIGEPWEIVSMDPRTMKVHLRHRKQRMIHDRVTWEDHMAAWRRELERFKPIDEGVTLVIEIHDIQPASIEPVFNRTIRAKQLTTA